MLDTVRRTINEYHMLEPGESVLCAFSGGADSTALLRVLLELGFNVRAYHLNHCLRGDESDRDEGFCRELCGKLGVKLTVERFDVNAEAIKTGESLETAARKLRYRRFFETAKGCKIATAHTSDDNVETVLFNLARGTGARGLSGIPPVRGGIIRPLINVSRFEVEEYLSSLGQGYVTDSTNLEACYTRNRIRQGAVPVLKNINPSLPEAVGRVCLLIRQDDECLEALAAEAVEEAIREDGSFEVLPVLKKHKAVRTRAIRLLAKKAGMPMRDFGMVHVEALDRWLKSDAPSASCSLPHGFTARREYGCGRISKEISKAEKPAVKLEVPFDSFIWDGDIKIKIRYLKKDEVFNKSLNTFCVDCGTISYDTFCVRTRREGDRICLNGKAGGKTLKKLMIDRRIPRLRRGELAVIADEKGVIAVEGIGVDIMRNSTGGKCLEIKIERTER